MNSHVITEYGKQNIFAKETRPYVDKKYKGAMEEAVLANGRWAMVGVVSAIGSYVLTGQIIPGIF